MKEKTNSRIYATLLGVGLMALLFGNPQSNSSEIPNDCGNNIWYGQFLNNSSGLYEYRQLDMSEGYTEVMLYGNDYYLVIYVKDIHGNMIGVTIPANSTFTFGVQEGELRRGH